MITDPAEDYARGWVPFLGAKIFLNSHPLIPRVETEYWTEKVTAMIYHSTRPMKVLDLCAGSGAIGVAVLARVPGASVDFGEIETRHFPTIKKTLKENSINLARARFFDTDVWSGITDRYDFILANPPYIARDAMVDPSLAHEPAEALFADDSGFALIEKTLRGAREHLNPGGQLWLEHDPGQSLRIATLATFLNLTITTHSDQFGRERYTVAYCRA